MNNTPRPLTVPRPLALATAWCWRLLIIAGAIIAVGIVVGKLKIVLLPVFLALFFTALLRPVSERLRAIGAPPFAAALLSVFLALASVGGIMAVVVPRFISELDELASDLGTGIEDAADWLVEGPLAISRDQLEGYVDDVVSELQGSTDQIASGVLSGAQVVAELATVLLIALFVTFFFLKDGDRIWEWFVGMFARGRRKDIREMGARSWTTLAGYLRGMTVVALFDSVFIGIALAVLGVPGALALAVITFFGAYVPIAGAVFAGMLAVLIALIAEGLVTALLVLAAVIVVQQTESNLLQPVVVGRAVEVHPIAIILGVTAGAVLGGILGAFVAVPVVAVGARIGGYIRERADGSERIRAGEAI